MVASGDEYAVKLYKQYQQQMPSFQQLSDQEITAILTYLEVQSEAAGGAASAVALN